MFTTSSATDQGSWLLAEALLRCDSARERLERAVADLDAIAVDCAWKAPGIALLLDRCAQQRQELIGVLDQLRAVESGLRMG
ncbi:MAG: hypothetical protein JST33_08475 [Actinobacteria bacterium]|nr:hypothetical protein [Actinomycetota bacterium]